MTAIREALARLTQLAPKRLVTLFAVLILVPSAGPGRSDIAEEHLATVVVVANLARLAPR